MIRLLPFVFLVSLTLNLAAQENHLAALERLQLGMPEDSVRLELERLNLEPEVFRPEAVRFPLARDAESHWRVAGSPQGNDSPGTLALVFADGLLAFVQASGGVSEWLESMADTPYNSYAGYRFYEELGVVASPGEAKLWLLGPEGLHLNLFAWDHPLLSGRSLPEYPLEVAVPPYLEMGASQEVLKPLLERISTRIIPETLDGSDPNAQEQLNCFGIPYAGFARKAEARFGDGKLNTVWILTAKAEEGRIRQLLQQQYGPPVFTSDAWEAYKDWQVFLRKDKPEVLFLTAELGHYYKKEYFGQ